MLKPFNRKQGRQTGYRGRHDRIDFVVTPIYNKNVHRYDFARGLDDRALPNSSGRGDETIVIGESQSFRSGSDKDALPTGPDRARSPMMTTVPCACTCFGNTRSPREGGPCVSYVSHGKDPHTL